MLPEGGEVLGSAGSREEAEHVVVAGLPHLAVPAVVGPRARSVALFPRRGDPAADRRRRWALAVVGRALRPADRSFEATNCGPGSSWKESGGRTYGGEKNKETGLPAHRVDEGRERL